MSGTQIRLLALAAAARFHGKDLDCGDARFSAETPPAPAALADWVRQGGLWAKVARLGWKDLVAVELASPIVLLLKDGTAFLVVANDRQRDRVWVRHAGLVPGAPPVALDAAQLAAEWTGEAILVRSEREAADREAPFTFGWVLELVCLEGRAMRDVCLASLVLSVLTVLPPLMVMTVIDQVVTHQSLSTLVLMAMLIGMAMLFETLLGYARRQMILVVGARVDARLNLHVFERLLRLPLDYFERTQAGTIWSMTGLQISKIREFLTGKLLTTLLDLVTLMVLLPILFYLQPLLSWIVLGCAGLIAAVIAAFMGPMSRRVKRWVNAETAKSSVMVEMLHGIRTVKALALEPQQRALWDGRVAEATQAKVAAGLLANLPQLFITPLEGIMQRGVLLIGAGLALTNDGTVAVGSLIGFMMLSARVAQPLANLARLMEGLEEVRTATVLAGSVLNQPPESANPSAGLRPRLAGRVTFEKVAYRYPGATGRALDGISFDVPAGTMLGIVGRSGSGKSTITRLLQGIYARSRRTGAASTTSICAKSISRICAAAWASCCRRTSCSAAPSRTTSWPAGPA